MEKETKTLKIIIFLLAVVLIFLLVEFWRQYIYIQRAQTVHGQIFQQVQQIAALRHNGPLTAANVSYIQAWMTFDYINTTFNLPPSYLLNYLKTDLSMPVVATQYPHISISRYARENSTSTIALTGEITAAVRAYLTASQSSSTETR